MKLKKIEEVVKEILTKNPVTRNSDNILYVWVLGAYNPDALDVKLSEYLMCFNDLEVPRFESVSRCRRKLQEKFPELRATEDIHKWRKENERAFRKYAKEKES